MTPAGTSNELDVQNGWEENTHTHTEVENLGIGAWNGIGTGIVGTIGYVFLPTGVSTDVSRDIV